MRFLKAMMARWAALAAAAAVAAQIATGSAFAHPPITLTPQGSQGVVEEVEAFRRDVARAVTSKDFAALRKIYAETFTHTHTSAKVDGKDSRIVSAMAGEAMIEAAPAEASRIAIFAGGWVAIATGMTPIVAMSDGKTYAVHWTATYVRDGDSWQLAASQATRGREITK